MTFELFIPYQNSMSLDIKDNLNDYYKTQEEYIEALQTEDQVNGMMVYNTMYKGIDSGTYYGAFNNGKGVPRDVRDKIVYARAVCYLLTPDASYYEDVDSMIDKFASQREFLVTAHFEMPDMDGEFEEEIREWAKETVNILSVGGEIGKKEGRDAGDLWIEKNIPRRDMRLSFLNKSGKRVSFVLKSCEIEKKIARNRYLFYVKRMEILK